MRIAIASGKGGTGKTTVAAGEAWALGWVQVWATASQWAWALDLPRPLRRCRSSRPRT